MINVIQHNSISNKVECNVVVTYYVKLASITSNVCLFLIVRLHTYHIVQNLHNPCGFQMTLTNKITYQFNT